VTPALFDPSTFAGVGFLLGLGLGVVGSRLWRSARERATVHTTSGSKRSKKTTDTGSLRKMHEEVEPVEPTDFTKFVPKQPGVPLPNLVTEDSEDANDETPSVSLVSFIDQLDPGRDPKQEELHVTAAGRTDLGHRRKRNEDRYVIVAEEAAQRYLFAVVDGMGGRGGGGVASRMAAEVLTGRFASSDIDGSHSDKRPSNANALVWAIEHANKAIFETAKETPQLDGMGSTIVAAVYDAATRCVYIAYVGDSRAYRLRRGRCELLTMDHTLAHEGPMAGYLRRAVGVRAQVKVDVVVGSAEPGDTYLLCTDGLTKMKTDKEIATLLATREPPEMIAASLIDEANRAGGRDNTAVVVFQLADRRHAKKSSKTDPFERAARS
jgi:PPM family protein phosphatase